MAYPQRRPHQRRALRNLTEVYQRTSRAQVYWACGTGKTLLGRWLHDDLQSDITLVLVPSLALVAQSLAEWQTGSPEPFAAIVVCSDPSTRDSWRIDRGWWADHGVTVTTDHYDISAFLRRRIDRPRVVFSTYHSASIVAGAARRAGVRFDLVVSDEAHRLAGFPDERFGVALDDVALPARRRLAVTATPVHASTRLVGSTSVSMSDKGLFGPVADRIDLADAIAAGLLVDYQVLVIDGTGLDGAVSPGTAAAAALVAGTREGLTRIISYHSRVSRARQFANDVHGLVLPDGRAVRASAVAGVDSTAIRMAALATLADTSPDTVSVVSNARCLAEGVNIPAVDGVIFADPRSSDVDIVQAIGRALRPAPGKTRGLIILPVVVPPNAVDDEELRGGAFATVWAVLRSLRDLDPRMAAELDHLRTWRNNDDKPHTRATWAGRLLRCDLDGIDLAGIAARVVDDTAEDESWRLMIPLLTAWAQTHGHTAVPAGTRVNGHHLGRWCAQQRRAYAANILSARHVARLDAVPTWSWTTKGAWWTCDHAAITVIARRARGLDLHDPAVSNTRLSSRGAKTFTPTVGRWCAQQRRAYRDGELSGRHTLLCAQIPGWTWTAGVPEREARMVDALAEWAEGHGHADVPPDATWGRLPLGEFIAAVRRRRAIGRLSPALEEDILLVTPGPKSDGRLDWRTADTRFELHVAAIRQYVTRTGGCDIPDQGVEVLSGWTANIGAWAAIQRHLRRRGELHPDRAALLESVPGWTWERRRKNRVHADRGVREHGTRLGYAAGCVCPSCAAVGRTPVVLVDATPARGHLRILEGQLGWRTRTAIRDITGLNKKSIDEISNGQRSRITAEVDQVIRALTAEQVQAHLDAHRSKIDRLPSEPTITLIEDLTGRGWPKAWISRELGKDGRALQIAQPGKPVRRETAEAVAALHKAVGRRIPPPRRQREPLPTLAEILADEQGTGKTVGGQRDALAVAA